MRVGKANATTTLIATGMSEAPRSGKAACRLDAARAGVASARAVRGATVGRVTSASGPRFSAMGRADGAGTGCGARAVRRRRWDGKIRALCMIRGVSATKRAPPWQDLRAVYSRKAICRTFRMHGAHILPKPARFGCMAAICCHGRMPGSASRRITIALPQNNAKGRIRGTPPTKTKEGERLLAFFRCLVLRLEWPGPSK